MNERFSPEYKLLFGVDVGVICIKAALDDLQDYSIPPILPCHLRAASHVGLVPPEFAARGHWCELPDSLTRVDPLAPKGQGRVVMTEFTRCATISRTRSTFNPRGHGVNQPFQRRLRTRPNPRGSPGTA